MDEETLQLILEAQNNASFPLRELLRDLREVDAAAIKLRSDLMKVGFGDIGYENARKASRRFHNEEMKAARDLARQRASMSRQEQREEEQARRQFILFRRRMDQQELAENRKKEAEEAKAHQQFLRHRAAMDRQYLAEQAAAQRAAAQRAREAQSDRSRGLGLLGRGAGNIVGGIGSLAGTGLSIVNVLGQGARMAQDLAGHLINGVARGLQMVERAALATGASVAAFTAITAHAGFEFNQFKENTLQTLEAMTKSADKAKKIFDFSFQLAIPAKFTFEEVLEGARTLEAFGMSLEKHGQVTGRFLRNAVALAQGMEKPLAQVTRFLGNLSQGRLLLQQAAPLGMGRPTLAKYGVEFDTHGSPADRSKLLEAAMRAIEDKWGNLIEKMGNTYESKLDSMLSMSRMWAGSVTEGMFNAFGDAYRKIADFFQHLIKSQDKDVRGFLDAIKAPFDLIGEAVNELADRLPDLTQWVASFATQDNIIHGLAEVLTLFQVIGKDVREFIDMASGGNGLVGLWENFKKTAGGALASILEMWAGFSAGVDYLLANGPKLWQMMVDGANTLIATIERLAGLLATKFGAQGFGGVAQTVGGVVQGVAGAIGIFRGFRGGGGAPGTPAPAPTGGGGGGFWGGAGRLVTGAGALLSRHPVAAALLAGVTAGTLFDRGLKAGGIDLSVAFGGESDRDLEAFRQNAGALSKAARERRHAALPGNPFSGLHGGSDPLAVLGRQVLGWGANTALGAIPGSVKDFGSGLFDAIDKGRGEMRKRFGQAGDIPGMVQANVDFLRGMLGRSAGRKAAGGGAAADEFNLPSEIIGGYIHGQGGPRGPRDKALLDELIGAIQERVQGMDRSAQPFAMRAAVPLLQEKLSGQYAEAKELYGVFQNAKSTAFAQGEEFQEDGKEAQDYWKAVRAFWDTQGKINQINRDAAEAVRSRMQEANDARVEMIRAQVELLPESERAGAAADRLVPELKSKQQLITEKMKSVLRGSKEYYDLLGQSFRVEKEIADLRNEKADQAARAAFEGPRRQFSTLKRLIGILPKGSQGGAARALLAPRILAAFQGAQQERDPVERQQRLLEVADMFAEFQSAGSGGSSVDRFFDRSVAAQRAAAVMSYRRRALATRGRRLHFNGAERLAYGAASPFQGGAGGGDNFSQIVLNLPPNASEEQIAQVLVRVLRDQLGSALGRR